jgi:hypothetical protein
LREGEGIQVSDDDRFEFASVEWIDAVRCVFEQVVASSAESGELDDTYEFSICEVYENVPSEINSANRVAWLMRVQHGMVSFAAEEADDVDFKVVGDYEVVGPLTRVMYDEAGVPPPDVLSAIMAATLNGTFKADIKPRREGSPTTSLFSGTHNAIVRLTR